MKKILNLLIIAVMLMAGMFLLTGCGNEKVNNDSKIVKIDEDIPELQEPMADLTTVDGWLSYWGLTRGALIPANFTRLDKTAYNKETGEIKDIGLYIDKKLTDEEARAWIEQVLLELTALSEEGKIINSLESDTELTADYIMEKSMHIGSGKFTYNGKPVYAVITVMPGQLDDSDPDIAMPACTLSLEH